MSKHYDEQFKKEIAKEYINGASVKELHEKYGVNKTSIYDWSRKYSNECHNTTYNKDIQIIAEDWYNIDVARSLREDSTNE